MRRWLGWTLLALGLGALLGCSGGGCQDDRTRPQPTFRPELTAFAELWPGEYDNEVQVASDPTIPARTLTIRRVLADSSDGYYLHVREADAELDTSVFQYVYRLVMPDDTTFWVSVFEPRDLRRTLTGSASREFRNRLHLDSLRYLRGCHLQFRPDGEGGFTGETVGTACPCQARAGDYYLSRIHLDGETFTRWDEGHVRAERVAWTDPERRFVRTRAMPLQ